MMENLVEHRVDPETSKSSLNFTDISVEPPENLTSNIPDPVLNEHSDLKEDESLHDKESTISSTAEEVNEPTKEDEWLDIMGSGNFKKKIIRKGLGHNTRPTRGEMVTVNMTLSVNGKIIEEQTDYKFIVGDMDVIQGIDLAICLMEKEEKALVIVPAKLAYGSKGRLPEIPPDSDVECDIELKEVQDIDPQSFSLPEILKLGSNKRTRGNFFYERGEFIEAIHCYERASDYLDGIQDCSGSSTEDSQQIVDMKIKVCNNMAAAHLKLSAYSAALKSVELVLKIQPNNVKALFRKAKILGAQGCTDEAIACLRLAASLEPETKIIQVEMSKLLSKRKQEQASQKAMYQRMFPQSSPKKTPLMSKILKWSMFTGSVLAVGVGMLAYRQFHS